MTKIERLISESYSGLHPSPALEDEILENLEPERARPRRKALLLVPIAAVLAIAVAFAFYRGGGDVEESFAGPGPGIELPVVARPGGFLVPRSNEETHVHLTRAGKALVLDDGWKPVSLDGLAEHLRAAKHKRVIVSADRAAAWQHLQWLMLMCAEAQARDIVLCAQTPDGDELRLDSKLPTDGDVTERHLRVAVTVTVKAGKVRYRFGDQEADELASVARWIVAARQAASNHVVRGEIRASATTPFDYVVKVLGEFRQAGFKHVDYVGTRMPRADERRAQPWPTPGAAWPGVKTLAFKMQSGEDLDAAVAIIKRRVKAAGLNVAVQRQDDTVFVVGTADTKEVRALVEQQRATLEFHLTVEPGAPNYEYYELRLRRELEAGTEFEKVRDVHPSVRARDDIMNDRYPLGLRWYRSGASTFTLCRNDDCAITADSLLDIAATEFPNGWGVVAKIKPAHRDNMARLTTEVGTHLAIIINGRVTGAPKVQSPIRDAVQITGKYTEKKARALAALLASEPLPVAFRLRRGK